MVTAPEPSGFTAKSLEDFIEKAFQNNELDSQRGGRINVDYRFERVVGEVMQEYRNVGWTVRGRQRASRMQYVIVFSRH